MPPSDSGVHELAEFAVEYANFSLFSERFFTYPILSSLLSQSLASVHTTWDDYVNQRGSHDSARLSTSRSARPQSSKIIEAGEIGDSALPSASFPSQSLALANTHFIFISLGRVALQTNQRGSHESARLSTSRSSRPQSSKRSITEGWDYLRCTGPEDDPGHQLDGWYCPRCLDEMSSSSSPSLSEIYKRYCDAVDFAKRLNQKYKRSQLGDDEVPF
jgi:hypothetical protein